MLDVANVAVVQHTSAKCATYLFTHSVWKRTTEKNNWEIKCSELQFPDSHLILFLDFKKMHAVDNFSEIATV